MCAARHIERVLPHIRPILRAASLRRVEAKAPVQHSRRAGALELHAPRALLLVVERVHIYVHARGAHLRHVKAQTLVQQALDLGVL